jgi:hypothetical protein
MKGRTLWIAALVVAIGFAVMIAYERPGEEQTSGADRPPARADELAVDVAGDASSETIVQDQAQDVPAIVSAPEQQQGAREAFPEQPFTPSMTQALQDIELLPPIPEFAEAARDFASQTNDPPWSEATESHIFDAISQATGLGASDIQVDCRTTMCRVQLSNPASSLNSRYGSVNEFVDTFGLETAWLWAGLDSNSNPINLVYLRRGDMSTAQSEAR